MTMSTLPRRSHHYVNKKKENGTEGSPRFMDVKVRKIKDLIVAGSPRRTRTRPRTRKGKS